MSERDLYRLNAIGRLVIGAGLLAAPAVAARGWIGRAAEDRAGQVFIRGFGARDMGIAIGTLAALSNGKSVKPWAFAALIADVTDALASAREMEHLAPGPGGMSAVAVAGSAAVHDLLALARID